MPPFGEEPRYLYPKRKNVKNKDKIERLHLSLARPLFMVFLKFVQ
jgi:hypothetical protein